MSGSLTTRVAIGIVQSAERWHARSGYGHGKLIEHPHLHCIVPGGELSDDGMRWIASREKFFLPVHVLSQVFRGKFLDELKSAYKAKRLRFLGRAEQLSQQCEFQRLVDRLYSKAWVVYAKQPFGGPKQVLAYLGRYTHRVAITNHRLVSLQDSEVTFQWRDYRDGNKTKLMRLDAVEFLRRFLLHVLPEGFCKIRYYGILSSRRRQSDLRQCQALFGITPTAAPFNRILSVVPSHGSLSRGRYCLDYG